MPEITTPATELTSQYAAQVTGDLERNVKEQERITADIASLQQQLAALQHDHTVLVNMRQALGITEAPAEPAATSESEKAAAKKSAAQAEGATTAAQPTLVELIRRHLAESKEPRSAAEISTALVQAHPERQITTKVVRVTLEGLVAKSQAERSKQGRSVFYTAPAPEPAGGPEAEAQFDEAASQQD